MRSSCFGISQNSLAALVLGVVVLAAAVGFALSRDSGTSEDALAEAAADALQARASFERDALRLPQELESDRWTPRKARREAPIRRRRALARPKATAAVDATAEREPVVVAAATPPALRPEVPDVSAEPVRVTLPDDGWGWLRSALGWVAPSDDYARTDAAMTSAPAPPAITSAETPLPVPSGATPQAPEASPAPSAAPTPSPAAPATPSPARPVVAKPAPAVPAPSPAAPAAPSPTPTRPVVAKPAPPVPTPSPAAPAAPSPTPAPPVVAKPAPAVPTPSPAAPAAPSPPPAPPVVAKPAPVVSTPSPAAPAAPSPTPAPPVVAQAGPPDFVLGTAGDLEDLSLPGKSGIHVNTHGALGGSGFVPGSLVVAGSFTPGHSPGLVEVAGDFALESDAVLEIELAGTDPEDFDRILIEGTATLSGVVRVLLLDDFMPGPGDSFEVLLAQAIEDSGATYELPDLGPDLLFHLALLTSDAGQALVLSSLVTVGAASTPLPEPGVVVLLASSLAGLALRRRFSR